MPIKDKEESGYAPTIPFNQVDNLSGKPQQSVATPSVLEVTDAALRKENYVTRFVYGERNPYSGQKPDAAYDPLKNISGYEDHAKWFSEANSDKEVEWIKRQVDQDKAHEDTLQRAGGWGTAARIVAGAITPDIAIGGVGIAAKGFKGAEMANVAMNAAGAGMISGTLYGTGQNVGNTSRDGLDIVKDAAMFSTAGALLSPVFHTVSSAFGSKAARTVTPAPAVPPVHVPDPAVIQSTAQSIKNYTQHASAHLASDAPLLADQQAERLAAEIDGMHYDSNAAASSSSQVAPGHTPPAPAMPYYPPQVGDMDLVGAFGAQKVGIWQTGVSLANSRFVEAKIAAQQLFRDMRWRKGNLDGSYTTLQSVESEFERLGHGTAGQGLEHQNATYKEYLKNYDTPQTLAYVRQKFGKDKMNFSEFDNEVGIAMSNADRHAVGEVEKVAQHGRTLIDSLASEAQRLGLLDTSGNLKGTALSYFGRSFNKDLMIGNSSAFKKMVSDEFKKTNPTWTQAELDRSAEQVYDHIISGNNSQLTNIRTIHIDTNGNIIPLGSRTKTGVAMERKLEIDDNVLEPFLDKSYEQFLRRYSNTVGKDIALTKMIGDTSGTLLQDSIRAEARAELAKIDASLVSDAEKAIARQKLDADLKSTLYHLENGVSLLNGTYKMSGNPHMAAATAAHAMTTYNYITKMGGAAVSSLTDPVKNVLTFGLLPTMKHVLPTIRQVVGDIFRLPSVKDPAFNAVVEANKRIGIGIETALHTRNIYVNDIVQQSARGNAMTRSLDWAAEKMGKLNMLDALTDIQKQMTGVLANDELMRCAIAETAGTATEREIANMRRFGIDTAMAQRIAGEFNQGVTQGHNMIQNGIYLTDTKRWADREAADTLERSLSTVTHSVVYNPSAGAKVVIPHNFFGKEMESMMTQFLSFNLGSHIQHFVPMLQKFDSATWSYIATSVAMGAVVYEIKHGLKQLGSDQEPRERNVQEMTYDAVSESGIAPMPFLLNSMASGMSRQLDARRLVSDDDRPTLAAQSFNPGSALLGPAGQVISNGYGIASDVYNDTVDRRTISKARQLIPFNNLFYARWLFNMTESQAQDMLDVPDKATVTITKRK